MIVKASELGAHTWGLEENFCVKAEPTAGGRFFLEESQALLLGFEPSIVNRRIGEHVPGKVRVHGDWLEVV